MLIEKRQVLRRSVDSLLNVVDSARDPGVRSYLRAIEQDQGAMVQLSPEAMDLLLASVADRSGVVYQSTASMSPVPSASTWLEIVGHPFLAASLALFSALHLITGNYDRRYPCASMSADDTPAAGEHNEAVLLRAFQRSPGLPDSDGVVPIRSQLWGRLIWAGLGDHLDVLGHYRDKHPDEHVDERHHDWLKSGSAFDDDAFESLMDAIAGGMLAAAR